MVVAIRKTMQMKLGILPWRSPCEDVRRADTGPVPQHSMRTSHVVRIGGGISAERICRRWKPITLSRLSF